MSLLQKKKMNTLWGNPGAFLCEVCMFVASSCTPQT